MPGEPHSEPVPAVCSISPYRAAFTGSGPPGALRAQIEAVRAADGYRGRGLGRAIFEWAIGEARRRSCSMVQLTSDKSRTDAHRFYERPGFVASHEGLKLAL